MESRHEAHNQRKPPPNSAAAYNIQKEPKQRSYHLLARNQFYINNQQQLLIR